MPAGRITASKLKAVCCTDPSQPSPSLIVSICYPELGRFKSAAIDWGCDHEKVALERYKSICSAHHEALVVFESGFFIHPIHPFMGASPDGLVACQCCGEGICEVKVSYLIAGNST